MTTCESAESTAGQVRLSQLISPAFYELHSDIRDGRHLHYWLGGGRGSTKSSFVSLEIILGMMKDKSSNAVCYRKVKATLLDSVYTQLLWAIEKLGVADSWRAALAPLSLSYLPTGQKVLFRGLDRAKKSKSLKAAHGYFKYLWFEELDEFSGPEELRSVCQSVLRGGERFCCFYTFNPPRKSASWVNREAALPEAGRILHKSDYRTVPRDWLGKQFFAEAERLKARNPQAYRHEYLGEAVGLGAEVFRNITLREITDAELAGFDKLLRGLDFGYATDPLHYTALNFDAARRRIFIFYELHARRLSNRLLAENILGEMALHGSTPVCCDSAEPKSIDDLYLLGVPAYPSKKGGGSVAWGLRFLAEELEEIIIDPARCPNTAREFTGYELDTREGGVIRDSFPDRDNHSIDAVRYAIEREARARYCAK